jgi:DNA-binding MarR family transcriptional regulator
VDTDATDGDRLGEAGGEALDELVARAVSRSYRRFRAQRADGELGDAAAAVLGHLYRYGAKTLTALSEHERVTPGSMSQTVNRLTALGLASRTPDPADGRRVLFALTDPGRELARQARERRHAWFRARLATRTDEERAALALAAHVLLEIADGP